MKPLITPEAKVGALLEAYPGLEEVLIGLAPPFARLRNPILRKTVAKVATLQQAAAIGGIGVRELVRKLREAAGQGEADEAASGAESCGLPAETPDWVREERVRHVIDAADMLDKGEHPLGKVREAAEALKAGEIVLLTSPFRPEPLIEALSKSGLAVYSREVSPGRHSTYISHPDKDSRPSTEVGGPGSRTA